MIHGWHSVFFEVQRLTGFVNEVLGKYLLLYDSTLHPLFIVD